MTITHSLCQSRAVVQCSCLLMMAVSSKHNEYVEKEKKGELEKQIWRWQLNVIILYLSQSVVVSLWISLDMQIIASRCRWSTRPNNTLDIQVIVLRRAWNQLLETFVSYSFSGSVFVLILTSVWRCAKCKPELAQVLQWARATWPLTQWVIAKSACVWVSVSGCA